MKSEIRKQSMSVVPLGNSFPPRHCSLCPKGRAIDQCDEYRLIDKRRKFKAGEIIAMQGAEANFLFVIHEGYGTASVRFSQKSFVSRFYIPGDIMALDSVEGSKYLTTIKAATDMEVCHIDTARLLNVAKKDASVATALIKIMSSDNVFIVEKIQRYVSKHSEARIAAFLVEFYEKHLRIGRPETTLRLPYTREEIAGYLELKIETVSRSLKSLEQQGLITIQRVRNVTINSYVGLKQLM